MRFNAAIVQRFRGSGVLWTRCSKRCRAGEHIQRTVRGYEQGAWKDAALNWIEETQENAVEVIATKTDGSTLALEHTLIELFAGEKYDSTIFTEAFASKIEKNPELTIPGRALDVMIPVGALGGCERSG
jgi:hypothetical protein